MRTILKYNDARINSPTDRLARNHEGRVFGRLIFQIENIIPLRNITLNILCTYYHILKHFQFCERDSI